MSWGLRKLQRIWNIRLRWGRMCMCFWKLGTWSFPNVGKDMDKGTGWRCETWRHFSEMENRFAWLQIKVQIVVEAAGRFWSLSSLIFLFLTSLSFMLSRPNISISQYSCLENSMDWGGWWATVHGVAKSWTRLSKFTFTFTFTSNFSQARCHL